MNTQARGIAFDMDGVISDSMPLHVEAWIHAFAQFDLPTQAAWFYLTEGILAEGVIERTLRDLQHTLTDAQKRQLYEHKVAHFNRIYRIAPIPGIYELVETIRAFGYSVVVATGSERSVAERVLRELKLDNTFTRIVTGADVQRGKPAPDPYLKAVELLDVPKANCFVLENAPPGVEAAKAAGLTCIAVQTYIGAEHLREADFVFPGLADVTALLRDEHGRSGGVGAWQFR